MPIDATQSIRPLNPRQLAFCRFYVQCWNGTRAALKAGYKNGSGIHNTASKLLRSDAIKVEVARLSRLQTIGKNEITARLSSHAKADIIDFFSPVYAEVDGVPTDEIVGFRLDLNKAIEAGQTHLIRKITQDRYGKLQVELHDAQSALVQLGRKYGLWLDKVAPTSPDGSQSWLTFDTVVNALKKADQILEDK